MSKSLRSFSWHIINFWGVHELIFNSVNCWTFSGGLFLRTLWQPIIFCSGTPVICSLSLFFSLIQYLIPSRLKKKSSRGFLSPYWKLKNYHSAAWPIKSEKFNCNNKLMLLVTPCFFCFCFFFVYLTSLHFWFWDSLPTSLSSYLDLLFVLNFFCPISLMSFFLSLQTQRSSCVEIWCSVSL